LRIFSAQKINLFAYTGEFEVASITRELIDALRAPTGANWIIAVSSGTETGRAVHGILVEIKSNSDKQSHAAAAALVSILKEQSLEVYGPTSAPNTGARMSSGSFDPDASITVTVGKKP
jgi:hypothetical protein